jgi:hypothetical protein
MKAKYLIKKLIQVIDNIYLKTKGVKYVVKQMPYLGNTYIVCFSYINTGTFLNPVWLQVLPVNYDKKNTRKWLILTCFKQKVAYNKYKLTAKVKSGPNGDYVWYNYGTTDFHKKLMEEGKI